MSVAAMSIDTRLIINSVAPDKVRVMRLLQALHICNAGSVLHKTEAMLVCMCMVGPQRKWVLTSGSIT